MHTHRFDPVSLIFGVVFTGIGVVTLQGGLDLWRINWSWFWPIALTLAGLAVLLSARASRDDQPAQPQDLTDDSEFV